MSKIALKPNDSGTGTFTLEAPNSNTNRTLTLPDEDGTVATQNSLYTDSDALDLFNATGSAPVYACRAWVNFDGTGTVSIRDSGNVSSITDNGTGDYTVNFATDMEDASYAAVSQIIWFSAAFGASARVIWTVSKTTTAITTRTAFLNSGVSSSEDQPTVDVAIFR